MSSTKKTEVYSPSIYLMFCETDEFNDPKIYKSPARLHRRFQHFVKQFGVICSSITSDTYLIENESKWLFAKLKFSL